MWRAARRAPRPSSFATFPEESMLSFRSLVVALLATLALVASARAQEESTPSTAPADTLTIDWAFTANQYPSAKPNAVVAMVCPSADRKDLDRGYIWGT